MRWLVLIVLLLAAAAVYRVRLRPVDAQPAPATPPSREEMPEDLDSWQSRMHRDPEGFFGFVMRRTERDRKACEDALAALAAESAEVRTQLAEQLATAGEAERLLREIDAARRRAEEEGSPALNVAGGSHSPEEAERWERDARQAMEKAREWAARYSAYLERNGELQAKRRKQIEEIAEVRKQAELEVRYVRMHQGEIEAERLRSLHGRLVFITSALGSIARDETRASESLAPENR